MTDRALDEQRRGKTKKGRALLLVLSTTFVLAAFGVLPFPAITVQWLDAHHDDSTQYVPSFTGPLEHELVLVYFGSAACGWCNDLALSGVIDSAKVAVREHAALRGASFSAVGIAIDWDTGDGVEHLEKIGDFDEIATGRSQYGLGARTWSHLLDGTPQVSVLERMALNCDEGPNQRFKEKELTRFTSLAGIASWVRRGAPKPAGANKGMCVTANLASISRQDYELRPMYGGYGSMGSKCANGCLRGGLGFWSHIREEHDAGRTAVEAPEATCDIDACATACPLRL